jgi:tetratricopeptide (TPR) repeat protein
MRSGLLVGAAAAALTIWNGAAAAGQTPADYLALSKQYATTPSAAANLLATWPRHATAAGVDVCVLIDPRRPPAASCDNRQRLAAGMMHTDAALLLFDTRRSEASFHIQLARRLLDAVSQRAGFTQRWFSLVASVYLSRGEMDDADDVLRDGLTRYPKSAALLTARGTLWERRALRNFGDLRTVDLHGGDQPGAVQLAAEKAARDYIQALEIDPQFVPARLRLGWNRVVLRDGRARADLEAALQRAGDAETRYLAGLFLGALDVRERRLEEALGHYARARAAGPAYQSACVAVSHTLGMMGRTAAARTAAGQCLALEQDDDPWSYFLMGASHPRLLQELRAEAIR